MKNYPSPRARLRLEAPYTTLATAALNEKLVQARPTNYAPTTRRPKAIRLRAMWEAA